VLASGTTESDLQMIESTLDKTLRMVIHQRVHRIQERQYLAVFL
jgi:hypothetical protein